MTNKVNARSVVEISVLCFLFVRLALLAFAFRKTEMLELISQGKTVSTSQDSGRAGLCVHLPSCLRVGDAWFGVALEQTLVPASRILDILPDRYPSEAQSIPVRESHPVAMSVLSVIVTRMLWLFPLLVATFFAYKSTIFRLHLYGRSLHENLRVGALRPPVRRAERGRFRFSDHRILFLLFVLISRGFMRSFVAQATHRRPTHLREPGHRDRGGGRRLRFCHEPGAAARPKGGLGGDAPAWPGRLRRDRGRTAGSPPKALPGRRPYQQSVIRSVRDIAHKNRPANLLAPPNKIHRLGHPTGRRNLWPRDGRPGGPTPGISLA